MECDRSYAGWSEIVLFESGTDIKWNLKTFGPIYR